MRVGGGEFGGVTERVYVYTRMTCRGCMLLYKLPFKLYEDLRAVYASTAHRSEAQL